MTAGNWRYQRTSSSSVAEYGASGGAPALSLRCDLTSRTVTLGKAGLPSANSGMIVRTSTVLRTLPTRGEGGYVASALAANDSLLDAMSYSRGRFAIQQAGTAQLIMPAWPEIARVVEDCRS